MYYQKYNKKEIRKNIAYATNPISIKQYITNLEKITSQAIAIENK